MTLFSTTVDRVPPGCGCTWIAGPTPRGDCHADVTPPAYKLVDNPDCLLDKSDLVFIDPVGTGFSRAVGKAQDKDFWGVDPDVKSLAQFVTTFTTYISRTNRWNSPKCLIGESYGTFRNAALANYLQAHDNMYLNEIVMVSTVFDLGTMSFYPGQDLAYILYLPSHAASAWFHKTLKDRPQNLNAFLDEARKFAKGEYADALMKGDALSKAEKAEIARKVSRFTGLSEAYLDRANLRVRWFQFMQELQRNRGLTTGRLEARVAGLTYNLIGEAADYDPQDTAISGAFAQARG